MEISLAPNNNDNIYLGKNIENISLKFAQNKKLSIMALEVLDNMFAEDVACFDDNDEFVPTYEVENYIVNACDECDLISFINDKKMIGKYYIN